MRHDQAWVQVEHHGLGVVPFVLTLTSSVVVDQRLSHRELQVARVDGDQVEDHEGNQPMQQHRRVRQVLQGHPWQYVADPSDLPAWQDLGLHDPWEDRDDGALDGVKMDRTKKLWQKKQQASEAPVVVELLDPKGYV